MYSKIRIISVVVFFLSGSLAFSQSAKKLYSAGEKFQELKNYKDAISNYTSSINLDPKYEKAYIARAQCYEIIGEKKLAISDYETALTFSPKEREYYYNSGKLYYELKDYNNADKKISGALKLKDDYAEAIDIMIKILHETKRYLDAIKYCEAALNIKTNSINYYNHAVTLDSLKSYEDAEKQYKQSKYYDSKFIPAYTGLAGVQMKRNKIAEAMKTCEEALAKDASNASIYEVRSAIYASKNDYQNAVSDMTRVIVSAPERIDPFLKRAFYFEKLGQYQNAVGDYTKVIFMDNKNNIAYYNRANCYAQLANFKDASKDYEKIVSLSPYNQEASALLKEVKKKLFEYNRETNKPEIDILSPRPEKDKLKVAGNLDEVQIKGRINDENQIKSITINGTSVKFILDTLNPDFTISIKIANVKEVIVTAQDIYDNVQKAAYTIERTEISKPLVALLAPYTSFDNEVYLDNNNAELYIEGKIKDESLIRSVIVDGVASSFALDQLNPGFSTKISIANKNKFTLKVTDVYGNETVQEYKLNRDGANMAENNPMGTTWMVFIENANYESFSSLEGPIKDIMLMKSALANYKVSKIIHKKDMTKNELEKFFAIELRDLLKSNNVNSVLVWYAGHGKLINETGYWVPKDAKVDDEITYFNIGSLKAYLQNYSRVIHTLVVTDACESGPTFLLAMRAADTDDKRCDDAGATKFKSSQVLTSAGFELASDNSQFTKTFAASLNNNPNACVSIDKIYKKISEAFDASDKQKPKFGRIRDLDDQGGSFFFIKK